MVLRTAGFPDSRQSLARTAVLAKAKDPFALAHFGMLFLGVSNTAKLEEEMQDCDLLCIS